MPTSEPRTAARRPRPAGAETRAACRSWRYNEVRKTTEVMPAIATWVIRFVRRRRRAGRCRSPTRALWRMPKARPVAAAWPTA
ncbi:hypothetical protein DF222_03325 [Corynebacterium yudongzhengii]|uniref:Uncharacterized protein n=1 Tax=Corynebacterium yudongzhengii TaxID=2080740 RepID=A0A2U1T841_9CORY|nr:hypothetical protein DF222_03325 [Corynebacterium yudongzhengii]